MRQLVSVLGTWRRIFGSSWWLGMWRMFFAVWRMLGCCFLLILSLALLMLSSSRVIKRREFALFRNALKKQNWMENPFQKLNKQVKRRKQFSTRTPLRISRFLWGSTAVGTLSNGHQHSHVLTTAHLSPQDTSGYSRQRRCMICVEKCTKVTHGNISGRIGTSGKNGSYGQEELALITILSFKQMHQLRHTGITSRILSFSGSTACVSTFYAQRSMGGSFQNSTTESFSIERV